MSIVHTASLAATLDALNETWFQGNTLTSRDQQQVFAWLTGRIGMPGSYTGMPAPLPADFRQGIKPFTGDVTITTRAGVAHVLGQEACRVLTLLGASTVDQRAALARASRGMIERLRGCESPGHPVSRYCCCKCSVALWRNLAAGGMEKQKPRLVAGLAWLKSCRRDTGRWHGFPFYYTLLALTEMDLPAARAELRFAVPTCTRLLRGPIRKDQYNGRRRIVLERVLVQAA